MLNKFTYNIQDILNIVILDKMWIDVGMLGLLWVIGGGGGVIMGQWGFSVT